MSWKNNDHKKNFNNKDGKRKPFAKKKEHYLDFFKGRAIEVRNEDVNGAIRRLKKVLEKMDFQKELSKREFYEKPSAKRKRMKDQAVKRHKKDRETMIMKGEWLPPTPVGSSHLKGKREKRKAWNMVERVKVLRKRGRGSDY